MFEEIDAWLAQASPRALLIRADYGVGKSAFLSRLLDRERKCTTDGFCRVVGWHFCQHDTRETLKVSAFVSNFAAQLKDSLPEYREVVESTPGTQEWIDKIQQDPASAFEAVILNPLSKLKTLSEPRLLIIDALDESLEVDAYSTKDTGSIVKLLADKASRLPTWLRVLVTARNNPGVVDPLKSSFGLKEIDAEVESNKNDLFHYVVKRCQQELIAGKLASEGFPPEKVATILRANSQGKFLYAVKVLDGLDNGLIDANQLEDLPPGMDAFYLDAFERRFSKFRNDYEPTRKLLTLIAGAREPLSPDLIAEILGVSEHLVQETRLQISDFIKVRHQSYAIDHFSLFEWLTLKDREGSPRARSFYIDTEDIEEAECKLTEWGWNRAQDRNRPCPGYVYRHLTAHLAQHGDFARLRILLFDFHWLQNKVYATNSNAIIADYNKLSDEYTVEIVKSALLGSAHILMQAPEQLAAQLYGRLRLGQFPEIDSLIEQIERVLDAHILRPVTQNLDTTESPLIRTMKGHKNQVNGALELSDGHLLSWSNKESIFRLWSKDVGTSKELAVFEGRIITTSATWTNDALELIDGRILCWTSRNESLYLLSKDRTSTNILEGHQYGVSGALELSDGRLLSWSWNTLMLWLKDGTLSKVLDGHPSGIIGVLELSDGRLLSWAAEHNLRLWSIEDAQSTVLVGHESNVYGALELSD